MTGYGRAQVEGKHLRVVAEVRSVNSRYLDLALKLPQGCWSLEASLRKMIQQRCLRGRIELTLRWESLQEAPEPQVRLHLGRARAVKNALETLQRELSLKGEMELGLFTSLKDLWELQEHGLEEEAEALQEALAEALEALDEMRTAEGEALALDLRNRAAWMLQELESIRQRVPVALEGVLARWRERVQILAANHSLDQNRMEQEAALWVDRLDISEEIVRTKVHLERFLQVLTEQSPVGKKLEFILQETHRELNTMGAKCMDSEISQKVVEMKAQLERMREQVQNLE